MGHLIGYWVAMLVVAAEFLAVFAYGWKLCFGGVEANGQAGKVARIAVTCGLILLGVVLLDNLGLVVPWVTAAPGHIMAWVQALPSRVGSYSKDPHNRGFLVLNSVLDAVLILLWVLDAKLKRN